MAKALNTPPVKKAAPYEPTELVIKEIMVQKNVTREKAIEILKNPTLPKQPKK